ncbi:DUF1911 domain-containing protein [Aggregatimonas sangjinii]|uniref:DUF1911 domain-containing protein n=1 Tax=Aggregatimonas sangjinii TaxID=2583587 RepID=A0A5B7SS88_9FLAO|nr:PoNe immunity protein domain-containing protein [Aggregatimonas sangjinii]QCW99872.1 DUF1911 domain-containing protein [Aggregatimonas sangjinii]
MKLRDKLNTEDGYNEIIEETKEFIDSELDDLASYNKDSANDKDKIIATYENLFKYNLELFETYYSLGEDVLKGKSVFIANIHAMQESWDAQSVYVQMVTMLSIGILLETEGENFNKLIRLVERDNVNDYLIDLLIQYRDQDWQQTESFLWNKPYKGIAEIVTLSKEDKVKALERLKKYLSEWYKSLETKTHESKWNIHTGYWCWEAGALVKILGLDDSSLKDQQYYPYDMVHWKD